MGPSLKMGHSPILHGKNAGVSNHWFQSANEWWAFKRAFHGNAEDDFQVGQPASWFPPTNFKNLATEFLKHLQPHYICSFNLSTTIAKEKWGYKVIWPPAKIMGKRPNAAVKIPTWSKLKNWSNNCRRWINSTDWGFFLVQLISAVCWHFFALSSDRDFDRNFIEIAENPNIVSVVSQGQRIWGITKLSVVCVCVLNVWKSASRLRKNRSIIKASIVARYPFVVARKITKLRFLNHQ